MLHKLSVFLLIVIIACTAVCSKCEQFKQQNIYLGKIKMLLRSHLPKLYDRCAQNKRLISTFDAGWYNLAALIGLGFFEVTFGVACVHVPKGFTITFYDRDNFVGRKTVFQEGTHSLFNSDTNLSAMSMVVETVPQFFSKCYWQKIEFALHPGWHGKDSLPNQRIVIRSIIIPNNYRVTLVYERSRRNGKKVETFDERFIFNGYSAILCLNNVIPRLTFVKGIHVEKIG